MVPLSGVVCQAAPVLGDHLAACRGTDGTYTFEHEAALLWL